MLRPLLGRGRVPRAAAGARVTPPALVARYYSIAPDEVAAWLALGWRLRYAMPTTWRGHGAVVWDAGDRSLVVPST